MLIRDIIFEELNTNIKIQQLYYSPNNSVSRDIGVSQPPNSYYCLTLQNIQHRILNVYSWIEFFLQTPTLLLFLVKRFGQSRRKSWGPFLSFLLIRKHILSMEFLECFFFVFDQLCYQNQRCHHVELARRLKLEQLKYLKGKKVQYTKVSGNLEP